MFYVSMTDKFMSGCGMSQGKTNKYVIACETIEQAEMIERNAKKRSEMKYVNICSRMPRYGANVLVTMKTFSDLSGPWKE
jgi:hypothetical protein